MASIRILRWEDYTVDGTGSGTLRNLPGFTGAQELSNFENDATGMRTAQLVNDPVQGGFDYSHLQEVHRRIFQDVYQWAGQTRVGPVAPVKMTKSGPDVSGGPNAPLG